MKEKIKMSIQVIIILLILTVTVYTVIKSGKTESEVSYKNLTISFEDDVVCFEEEFYFNKSGSMLGLVLELQSEYINNSEMEVWLDNIEVKKIGIAGTDNIHFRNKDKEIYIGNIRDNISDGDHKITVKYNIKSGEIVTEYNNISSINLDYKDFTILKNVILIMPEKTKRLEISDSRLSFEKTNSNTYVIDTQEMRKNIKIIVDKGSIQTSNKIYEDYQWSEEKKEEEVQKTIKVITTLSIIITLINNIIVYIIIKHKKYDKQYYRNAEDVIDVTLAESIIDKKINSNNLIMSVIVDQINCGNIIMDNEKLILKKYDDKSEIKRKIIDMFFKNESTIEIKELSKVFKDNKKIDEIIKKFKEIKIKILETFYNLKLYDKKKEKTLKINRIISIALILSTLIYVTYILYGRSFVIINTITVSLVLIPIIAILKKSKIIHRIPVFGIPIVYFGIVIIGTRIINTKPIVTFSIKPIEILIIFIAIIINIITIKMSKKHVFTKEGLEEYKKVKGLSDYLIDYSLIKERDIQSVIIWDKYLVYATAFGIPSKVTEKFSEALMDIAETLDKINKMLIYEDYYYKKIINKEK